MDNFRRSRLHDQEQPSGICCLNVKICLGIVAVLFGPISFIAFVFVFQNYNAGIWGLFGGIVATFTLHLNLSYKYGRLTRFYTARGLRLLQIAAYFSLLASVTAALAYFIYGKVNKIPFSPVQGSPMIAGVQAMMAVKACIFYILSSYNYLKVLDPQDGLSSPESVERSGGDEPEERLSPGGDPE